MMFIGVFSEREAKNCLLNSVFRLILLSVNF